MGKWDEDSYWSPLPREYNIGRLSSAGELRGRIRERLLELGHRPPLPQAGPQPAHQLAVALAVVTGLLFGLAPAAHGGAHQLGRKRRPVRGHERAQPACVVMTME